MKDRFIARVWDKPDVWGVYDTVQASWPGEREDTGKVKQKTSKADAEAEAKRLNDKVANRRST